MTEPIRLSCISVHADTVPAHLLPQGHSRLQRPPLAEVGEKLSLVRKVRTTPSEESVTKIWNFYIAQKLSHSEAPIQFSHKL